MVLPLLAGLPLLSKILFGTAAAGLGVGAIRAATGTSLKKEDEEDDPLAELRPSRGALVELLEGAGQTSQPIQNLFAGRFGAAGRQTADTLGNLIDMVLPGDVIPQFSKKSDFTSPSELLGMENAPALAKLPVDIAGDILTSPLSAFNFAGAGAATGVRKGLEAAARTGANVSDEVVKAAGGSRVVTEAERRVLQGLESRRLQKDALPRLLASGVSRSGRKVGSERVVQEALERSGGNLDELQRLIGPGGELAENFRQGGTFFAGKQIAPEGFFASLVPEPIKRGAEKVIGPIARATGNPRIDAFQRSIVGAGRGASFKSGTTAAVNADEIFKGMPLNEREAVFDVVQNVRQNAEGVFEPIAIGTPTAPFEDVATQVERLVSRAKEHATLTHKSEDELRKVFGEVAEGNRNLIAEDVRTGVMRQPRMWTAENGGMVPQDEMVQLFRSEGLELTGEAKRLDKEIQRVERLLDRTRARRQELRRGGNVENGGRPVGRDRELAQLEADRGRLLDELGDARDQLQQQLDESAEFKDWAGARGYQLRDVDLERLAPPDYLQRIIRGTADEGGLDERAFGGNQQFTRGRTADDERFLELLNDPNVKVERDALRAMRNRAQQQGKAVGQAKVMRALLGDTAVFDKQTREMLTNVVDGLRKTDPDFAQVLDVATKGLPKRGGFLGVLAGFNRFWKPSVLYGFGIPRFAAPVKNRVGALFQELATEGTKTSLPRMADDFRGIMSDGLREWGVNIPRDKLGKALDAMDQAFTNARGDPRQFGKALDELIDDPQMSRWMREAVDTGALEGFIDTENLLSGIALLQRGPKGRKMQDLLDVPGKMFAGVEHRLRLGQFLQLRQAGTSADEAARLVQKAYLDYSQLGVGDRAIRDIIPFAAFMTRTIPQQGSFLARRPIAAVGMSSLFGNDEDLVLPSFIQEQASTTLGRDKEGNVLAAAGLGLPAEALNLLPSSLSPFELGETARRSIVASSSPLLKTAYSFTAGRDPFFDSPVGSYDRTPRLFQLLGAPERSEFGRAFNLLEDTGITAPISTPLGEIDKLLDERKTLPQRGLNLLTGARIFSVDEDKALEDLLQNELRRNPRVRTFEVFNSKSDDQEVSRLLEILRETKSRIRERRQALSADG